MHSHENPNRDVNQRSRRIAALQIGADSPDEFSQLDVWRKPGTHAMFDLLVMRISQIPVTRELSREDAGWFGSKPRR
jgi:hypothetical protein